MSQSGGLSFKSSGAAVVETITGNSGGAVGPDGSFNLNLLGNNSSGINIVGNPGANTLTVVGIQSTTTQQGTITLASNAQAIAGTDAMNAVTSAALAAKLGTQTAHTVAVFEGSTSALTGVSPSTAGFVLVSNGVSSDPSFQSVSATGAATTFDGDTGATTPTSLGVILISGGSTGLTTNAASNAVTLTGVLDLASGGTSADLTASNGGIFYSTASAGAILSGTATARQMLQSGASTTPAWSTSTWPATTSINQILYSSSANTVAGLATGNNGVLITGTTGIPSILADGTTGQVLTATTGSPPSWANPATSGTVTSVSVVSANGFAGTVATATTTPAITLTTTQTGLLSGNGTAVTGTAITQYNVLTAGASNAPNSVAPSATSGVPLISQGAASQPVFGTAVVAGGGTAATSFNTTGVVISGATSTTALSAITLTDGQLAIGSSAGNPAAATLTAGTGVTITNGHNSITISSSSAGFTWNDVTTTPTTMAAENGYIADSSSFLAFFLPTNNSLGDTIKVVGKGTGLWTVETNGASSSYIKFGSLSSTPSVGFLTSTNANDCVELVCTTASASSPIWTVVSSIGNIQVG